MRLALEADMTIVGEASNRAEALEQVQRLQPAIVLMDLALPDRDGIAVIAALRAAHTTSAVIILSGKTMQRYERGHKQQGRQRLWANTKG